tara:strand:- start:323 stop:706 length:384 start_codon:yes stop_codon:yes gene_type:complete
MEIEIIEVPKPMIRQYGKWKINVNKIREEGKVRVIPDFVTKTRISTCLQQGDVVLGIDFQVDGIKTYEDVHCSDLTHKIKEVHYFVKSKKQGFETYKKYVREVVKKAMSILGVEIDKLIVELEVWEE